jgi:hypothetical protein
MNSVCDLRIDHSTTRKLYDTLEGFCQMLNVESGQAPDAEIYAIIEERHGTHFAQLWWHARKVLHDAQWEA